MVYTIPEIRDLLLSSQIISVRYSSRGRFYDAGRVRDEMTAHALPYAQRAHAVQPRRPPDSKFSVSARRETVIGLPPGGSSSSGHSAAAVPLAPYSQYGTL